jgi:hypothetical protein
MEREIKNNKDMDTSLSNERLEGLAASEMADRGPKPIDTTKNNWPDADGKTSLMGVSNPGNEAGDDDDDDDDDIDLDDDEDLDAAAPAVADIDSVEIDDTDVETDLDITLDDDEEEEEDI